MRQHFDPSRACVKYCDARMLNASYQIEQPQEMFEAPDIRPLSASDISAANRRHDERLALARGFSFGSGMACVAGLRLKNSD